MTAAFVPGCCYGEFWDFLPVWLHPGLDVITTLQDLLLCTSLSRIGWADVPLVPITEGNEKESALLVTYALKCTAMYSTSSFLRSSGPPACRTFPGPDPGLHQGYHMFFDWGGNQSTKCKLCRERPSKDPGIEDPGPSLALPEKQICGRLGGKVPICSLALHGMKSGPTRVKRAPVAGSCGRYLRCPPAARNNTFGEETRKGMGRRRRQLVILSRFAAE